MYGRARKMPIMQCDVQGRSDGGYIGIYTPPKKKINLPYKFLCGYWLFFDIVPVCALAKLAKLKFIGPVSK